MSSQILDDEFGDCYPELDTNHIVQVRLVLPSYWSAGFITIRRQFDIDNNLRGRTYRHPEMTSWNRLARLMFDRRVPTFVDADSGEIVYGDQTPMPNLFSYLAKKDRQRHEIE